MGFSSEGRELVTIYTSEGKEIIAVNINGRAFVGDMLLGNTEQLLQHGLLMAITSQPNVKKSDITGNITGKSKGHGITTKAAIVRPSSGFKWPNGIVPYQMSTNLTASARNSLNYAINHWNNSGTGVQLVPRTNQTDYIYMIDGVNNCWSALGHQGGYQELGLGAGCGAGAAVHEIAHALGFSHEQSRTDRDNYVTIVWNNIAPAMQYNFQKITFQEGFDYGTYDYYSIMHYFDTAFTINGYKTILMNDPSIDTSRVGFSTVLSARDIAAAKYLYGGNTASLPNTPNGLIANSITNSSFNLTWSPVSGASNYDVERWDGFAWVSSGTTTNNNITITGLSNIDQFVKVKARNSAGSSEFSDYISVSLTTTPSCTKAPSVPTGLNYNNSTYYNFTANWYQVSGATSYDIQLWSDNGWTNMGNVKANAALLTKMYVGGTNYYGVRANNACGSSAYSDYSVVY